jgi:hypothetical protein
MSKQIFRYKFIKNILLLYNSNNMSSFFKPSSTSSTKKDSWFPALPFSNRRKNPGEPPKPSPVVVDAVTKEEIPPTPRDKSVEEKEKAIPANPIIINPQTQKIERPLNAIVSVAVKKYVPFQNELAYLSRSDAHHDLGDLFKDSVYKKESRVAAAFDSALPVPATVAFHEGDAFASVVISATNPSGSTINIHTGDNKQEDYLQEALNQVPDCTARDTGAFSTFAIGIGGDYIFKYRVVRFVTKCSNNKNFKGANLEDIACKSNFGKNFVTNTKLGEDVREAAIIVDFSQHHFMEDLASGDADEFKIHYLMTPEVVNDPAGKPNINNRSLFGVLDKGVKLRSYVQTDPEIISYTKFNPNEPSTANNFFSNYTFELSPIKQIFTKQKAEKLISNLNVSYDGGTGKPLTDTIEDSKGENSITTVLGYLKKILEQIRGSGGSPMEKFNFNTKIQQKRGGDWFQALSCLTAKNRNYTLILPSTSERRQERLSPDCPVYLVTHDRIAVAFALLNGVNVIYLDYYGRIFIFKNGGDPTLKSSGKTMEHILFEGIKSEWNPTNTSIRTFSDTLNTGQIYTTVRTEYVTNQRADFVRLCDTIRRVISTIGTTKDRDAAFQRDVTKNLRDLFTSAVKLAFINMNLINISSDYNYVNTFDIRIFNGNYDERYQQDIAKFSKALNNIKSIRDRFGNMAPSPSQSVVSSSDEAKFRSIIPIWVDSNSRKIDVYRVASKILETTVSSDKFDLNRLLSIFSSGEKEERKTDMHIFLPFIQTLDSQYKTLIIDIINQLVGKTSEYYTNVVKDSKAGRSGISSQQAYYNNLANLLYESVIFLKTSSSPSPTVKPEISTSTDNILLNEEYSDLKVIRGDGKYSGNTENAPESSSTRGGSKFIDLSTNPKKESVICDVSVKQVTWNLLTANLVDSIAVGHVYSFSRKISNELDLDDLKKRNPVDERTIEKIRSLNISENSFTTAIYITATASAVHDKMGGGLTRIRGGNGPSPVANLMLDFDLGVHPLTPVYSMLTSYYNIIGEKSNSDPFFYTYFTYINVLEKMKKVIEERYLSDVTNKTNVAAAFIIGFGLYTMLFASHTSLIQNNEILSVIQMSQQEYHEFSLKNDCFASVFSGAIHQTPEEEAIGLVLVNNKLFNNFINNEVNIKQILQQGTSVDNLPNYIVLKDRIFKLMGEIVVKVNSDRGTPIGASTSASASGVASGIRTPAIFTLMPKEQQKELVYATSSTRGGKQRSKRKTIKKRSNKRSNKSITKKRYRKKIRK